jgi:hypothetical protein
VFAAVSIVAVIQPVPVLAFVGDSCAASRIAFNGTIWPRISPPGFVEVWMFT